MRVDSIKEIPYKIDGQQKSQLLDLDLPLMFVLPVAQIPLELGEKMKGPTILP